MGFTLTQPSLLTSTLTRPPALSNQDTSRRSPPLITPAWPCPVTSRSCATPGGSVSGMICAAFS